MSSTVTRSVTNKQEKQNADDQRRIEEDRRDREAALALRESEFQYKKDLKRGGRMRYKTNRRRGKTNRRRMKTNRRRSKH